MEEEIGGGVLATALVAAITPRTSGPGRVVCVGRGGGGGGGGGAGNAELLEAVGIFCFCQLLPVLASPSATVTSTSLAAAFRKISSGGIPCSNKGYCI